MPSEPRQRIAIADKNPVVRTGLVDIVGRDGRFEVVATVATGRAFLDLTAERPVDIGVIGWSLTDMSGGDVLATVKRRQALTGATLRTMFSGTTFAGAARSGSPRSTRSAKPSGGFTGRMARRRRFSNSSFMAIPRR